MAAYASVRDLLEVVTSRSLRRQPPSTAQSLALLATGDDDLLEVVAAAGRVRHRFFGRRVRLNALVNLRSGHCPEDCAYCSQRRGSAADVARYSWLDPETVAEQAARAVAGGVSRVCLVASGRGPGDRDVDRVGAAIEAIRRVAPGVEICTSLGLLRPEQAERLRAAGVHAYNHNLNTSQQRYPEICSTHTHDDRVDTVRRARAAGLSPCSGAIFGLGERDEEIVEVAAALHELRPDSVPVNFLIPFDGTPMGGRWDLTPRRCLRILALFRFWFPDTELRLAGGREIHLRSLQPLALHLVDSIFLGDYLTSEGQPAAEDLAMIADAGMVVEGDPVDTYDRLR